jgi:carboxypeptidase PM20D1
MSNDLTRAYLGAVGQAKEGEIGAALRRFAADPNDAAAAEALAKAPEFVGTTRTTCVATVLSAGHAENALPQSAKVTRLALQNAASVAGLLLTTEVMVAVSPKD